MRVIIDTCVCIWTISDSARLTPPAEKVLKSEDTEIFVSVISSAEITCTVARGRQKIAGHWKTGCAMPEYIDQPENRIGATFVLQKKHDDISCLYRYTMVMGSIDRIFEEAVQLPQDQRLELAYRLLVSNEPAADKDLEGEWDTAICERIERYEKGEGRRRLAGEVFSDLDKRLTK